MEGRVSLICYASDNVDYYKLLFFDVNDISSVSV